MANFADGCDSFVSVVSVSRSVAFGEDAIVLPNGNIVVVDSQASIPATDAGAVHLYSPAGVLISTLRGAQAFDQIGNWGITVLANGNFVVESRDWDNGPVVDAGAVTFVNGTTGLSGTVSAANSLTGVRANDRIGSVSPLANGHFIVTSPDWDNGTTSNVGAVTWVSGTTGRTGPVTAANSLIGSTALDFVGS